VRRRSVSPHARYSPNFPYRRFCTLVWFHAPSFRVGLMFSSYELRFVFPSWLARASVYFPSLPLPPFHSPFPLSHFHHSHAHSHFSRTSQPKKLPSTKFPITHSCLGIYLTQTHILSRNIILILFLFILFLHSASTLFPPVIIMCSLVPFFFHFRALSLFFFCFLHCCISILLIVNRRTFHFPSLRTASNPCVIYRYLCDCHRILIIV